MALTAKKVYAILKRQISDMEAKLNSPVRYRGTVATADLLPLNPDIGDMYNIESKSVYGEAGMNVAWNGVVWDTMGAPIDMSLYLTKEEAEAVIQRLVTEYFEKNPVKPGATTEQAQQIEQNKTDIASLKTETGSLKEDISNKITKFYASSQGKTHLADSDNDKIMDMMLYGKSEQKQYSGKNLLKPHTVKSETLHGVTCTYNNDGSVSLKGTAENDNADFYYFGTFAGTEVIPNIDKTKTYTLAGTGTSKIQLFASGLGNSTNGTSITSKGNDIFYVMYRVPNGITVDATIYPQIELGSEPTTYEPYTGGIPSPNPDYPQEIKSVVNPTVKIIGKNLLNATLQTATQNGVTCTNNGDGTYTLNGKLSSNTIFTLFSGSLSIDNKSKIILMKNDTFADLGIVASYCAFKISSSWDDAINYPTIKEIPSGKIVQTINLILRLSNGGAPVTLTNILIKPMIVDASLYPDATYDDFEPYHEQTVTLPYTLNAIPVESGGNVTIGSQEYIADYVDVERGKLVRMCKEVNALDYEWTDRYKGYVSIDYGILPECVHSDNVVFAKSTHDYYTSFQDKWMDKNTVIFVISDQNIGVRITYNSRIQSNYSNLAEFKEWLKSQADNGTPLKIVYALATPEEIDLAPEEITAFKALATYYPTTNISANSEQLDGYTVFNYPISMANGWNYVKQQLNDNRDYIYDMDLQSAEAYVNSEYAVALTELEV